MHDPGFTIHSSHFTLHPSGELRVADADRTPEAVL